MKIVKPDNMAIVHRALRLQGQDRLCVGLVALFPLASAHIDALRPETELWRRLPQAPGAPPVLDEGYPKPKAEFLLYGEACAPGGTAVAELAVRVHLGSLDKPLIVHGDRHWTALGTASSPAPFVRMPIVPATAFGGTGDTANPLGKCAPELPNVEDPRHPIAFKDDRPAPAGYWGVDSGAPQRQRHLGAVGTPWLQKTWPHLPEDTAGDYFQSAPPDQRLAGYFVGDEAIELTHLHPEHPRIDSALPALRGRCFALHGEGPDAVFKEIETRAETLWLMPGLGLGALLYRGTLVVADEEAQDVACVVAGWEPMGEARWPEAHYRDQLPAETPKRAAAAGAKAAQSAPALAAAAAAASALAAAAPASMAAATAAAAGGAVSSLAGAATQTAMATGTSAIASAAAKAVVERTMDRHGAQSAVASKSNAPQPAVTQPALDPGLAEIERMTAEMIAQTDRMLAEHGVPRSQIEAMMRPPPSREVSLAEIEAMTLQMEAERGALLARNGLTQADVDAFIKSRQGELPTAVSLEDIEAQTQKMHLQTAQLMREHGIDHDDVAAFLSSRGASKEAVMLMRKFPQTKSLHANAPKSQPTRGLGARAAKGAAGVAGQAVVAVAAHAAVAVVANIAARGAPALASAKAAGAAAAAPKSHPPTNREEVIAWHAQGRSFAELELGGLDLSHLDLSGADFSAAKLENTRFDRSRLVGTRFDRAILQGASLEGVDATQASFQAVRAAGSRFAGATLVAATLDAADFNRSDFSTANLQDAHCARTEFSASRMAGLRAAKLRAERADFSDCDLEGANLQGATLTAARFDLARIANAALGSIQAERSEWYQAEARQADFAGANLRGARAGAGSVFAGANLRGANLEGAAWSDGVDLQGAALHSASLDRADFSGAQAAGLLLAGASAQGANFSHAALAGADASGANLMGASLRHAQLAGARLGGANLHASDGYGSTIAQAHVAGALTTGTLMQIPGRPEAVKA